MKDKLIFLGLDYTDALLKILYFDLLGMNESVFKKIT